MAPARFQVQNTVLAGFEEVKSGASLVKMINYSQNYQ